MRQAGPTHGKGPIRYAVLDRIQNKDAIKGLFLHCIMI